MRKELKWTGWVLLILFWTISEKSEMTLAYDVTLVHSQRGRAKRSFAEKPSPKRPPDAIHTKKMWFEIFSLCEWHLGVWRPHSGQSWSSTSSEKMRLPIDWPNTCVRSRQAVGPADSEGNVVQNILFVCRAFEWRFKCWNAQPVESIGLERIDIWTWKCLSHFDDRPKRSMSVHLPLIMAREKSDGRKHRLLAADMRFPHSQHATHCQSRTRSPSSTMQCQSISAETKLQA